MFDTKTVFVVGAGASAEVGLPVGAQLKKEISNALRLSRQKFGRRPYDTLIGQALEYSVSTFDIYSLKEYLKSCAHISEAVPAAFSIDNFLSSHFGNEAIQFCGKLAITRCILEAERNSRLFHAKSDGCDVNLAAVEDTWFSKLFRLLSSRVHVDHVAQIFSNVSFINFNYDRCLEHYLLNALTTFYQITSEAAAAIISNLRIFHPYGQIGHLPWQLTQRERGVDAAFGSNVVSPEELIRLSSKIQTFNEERNSEFYMSAQLIGRELSTANHIIFLGFSFQDQNMEILKPQTTPSATRIFATAFGISASDREIIRSELLETFDPMNGKIQIDIENNLKCDDLFNHFHKSISSA